MSKVVTNDIVGQLFNPIVTSADWTQLNNLMNAGPIDVTNSVIFSVPNVTYKNNEDGELEVDVTDTKDIINEASIWITDNLGNLYPMSFPYNIIKDTIEQVKNFFNNPNNIKSISEIYFNNSSIEGSSKIGNSIQSVYSSITVVYNDGSTRVTQPTSFQIYTSEQCHDSDKYNGASMWYNTEGTYYIKGYYEGSFTTNTLKWRIYLPTKISPEISYSLIPNNTDGTLTILIKSNLGGKFDINILSGNIQLIAQSPINAYLPANNNARFVYKNDGNEDINATFAYDFIPSNTVEYESVANVPFEAVVPAVKIETPYYFYVGFIQPNNSTTISDIVNKGEIGWHLIGDTLEGYSLTNPIYNGGNPADCINLNEDFDDVDYYIALPDGVYLRDGSGQEHNEQYLIQSGININGHTYNIFKDHFSDFMFIVY
jgi:hypothetical protein